MSKYIEVEQEKKKILINSDYIVAVIGLGSGEATALMLSTSQQNIRIDSKYEDVIKQLKAGDNE